MSKDREVLCIHYECAHHCEMGKDAMLHGSCQKCGWYEAQAGRKPARNDHRRESKEKALRREIYE